MLFRRLSQFLAVAALAIAFVVFAGAAGGSEAKAQGIYRNYYRPNAIIRQRERERERFLWHRRQELRREAWRRHYRSPYHYYGRYPYRRW
jgi:nicotinamide mononucleotide (NMN) deamidase PncC